MKNLKLACTALTLSVSLSACGCGVINSNSDEIRQSDWVFAGRSAEASLVFDGNNAEMTVKNADGSDTISGLCVIDDERIVIIDSDDTYSFTYTLGGKKLLLSYGGGEITFKRNEKTTAASALTIGEAP